MRVESGGGGGDRVEGDLRGHLEQEDPPFDPLTKKVIGCAIEVHRRLGPGLLESAYEECLCYELRQAGLRFERQMSLPVVYKAVRLDCGYRIDLMVGGFWSSNSRRWTRSFSCTRRNFSPISS